MRGPGRSALLIGVAMLALAAVAVGLVVWLSGGGGDRDGSPTPTVSDPTAGSPYVSTPPDDPTLVTPSSPALPSSTPEPQPTATTPPEPPASGGDPVEVSLSYAGWVPASGAVEAGGFAATLEGTGTCTLSLVRGDRTVTAQIEALPDASTMNCGGLSVPGGSLSPGTWTARLGYASATRSGTSTTLEVQVP